MSVVVGIDGSAQSWAAMQWARSAADLRGTQLEVIIADEELDAETPTTTAEIVARAHEFDANAVIQVVEGEASPALLAAARDAELMVVGSSGLGRLRAFVADSVAAELLGHSTAPVALIRHHPEESAPDRHRIVVGVDERSGAQVLPFAFAEAALRKAELRVVSSWESQILTTFGAAAVPTDAITAQVESELELLLDPLREQYPEVTVSTVVEFGSPAASIANEAAQADVVIVGSDGPGGFARLMVGSIAQSVVHDVQGPVIVVSIVNTEE